MQHSRFLAAVQRVGVLVAKPGRARRARETAVRRMPGVRPGLARQTHPFLWFHSVVARARARAVTVVTVAGVLGAVGQLESCTSFLRPRPRTAGTRAGSAARGIASARMCFCGLWL